VTPIARLTLPEASMLLAHRITRPLIGGIALTFALAPLLVAQSKKPTIEQFISPASALELASAKKADRLAWPVYERGMRNVYTAAAPSFTPVALTRFLSDDGIELSDVSISDDGAVVVFVRGVGPNREGWNANPSHDPNGGMRAIWAARTTPTVTAWKLADGSSPELSPDGRFVLYLKDGQIYRARVSQLPPTTEMDKGEAPFIKEWGTNSAPRWSPDGTKIAFVSNRNDHAFIGLYDVATRTVSYVSPSVDFDGSPVWSPDSKRIAFTRRPGMTFGQQVQAAGNAAGRGGRAGGGGGGAGRGGPGGRGAGPDSARAQQNPGLYRATFNGGYTLSVMVSEVAGCSRAIAGCVARELWHNQADDPLFGNIANLRWAGDNIVFPLNAASDQFERYYSISIASPAATPVLLTTTNGLIEDATSVALSGDGKTLYYTTNAGDIERRHIWAVPTSGGTPRQVTSGEGIETYPAPLASGKRLGVLYFDARQPASVGLVPVDGGKAKVIFPTLPKDYPLAAHVVPEIVHTKAADGLDISNQLFLPKDLQPGERRPALVFVHGGPRRQMLPGYHYMQFYHWAYAFNQYLASQGYIVLSVNYRSGIGYGRSFREAPNTGAAGNSEYQDVLAGGKYLQSRPDVDPARVGIWGLSYGGILTAQALARNSDVFVAGVDLAGVHLRGNTLDSLDVSYRSSAIAAIDGWKSPVLLVHGDDDRNVEFSQTVGLVQLLRARNIYHELIVIPDDTHESMLYSRWVYTWHRMDDFLRRFVREKSVAAP
jgi:dipeptidyl aminopeptidase/acylaminoacyl peptidase